MLSFISDKGLQIHLCTDNYYTMVTGFEVFSPECKKPFGAPGNLAYRYNENTAEIELSEYIQGKSSIVWDEHTFRGQPWYNSIRMQHIYRSAVLFQTLNQLEFYLHVVAGKQYISFKPVDSEAGLAFRVSEFCLSDAKQDRCTLEGELILGWKVYGINDINRFNVAIERVYNV